MKRLSEPTATTCCVGVVFAMWFVGCAEVLGFEAGASAPEGDAGASAGGVNDAHGNQPSPGAGAKENDVAARGNEGGQGGSGDVSQTAPGGASLGGAGGASDCGNDRIDPGEQCDGGELGGETCATAAHVAGGSLMCSSDCSFDFNGCYSVKSLSVRQHVCAVLSNGKLKCWGKNLSGELGLGDRDNRGEEAGEMGDRLPFVDIGDRKVLEVAAGGAHTCVLAEGNQVLCWGSNYSGEAGVPGVDVVPSPKDLPAIELGPEAVKHIVAGEGHSCALFQSGKVKCWGANYTGQLGLGDTRNRGREAGDLGEALPFVETGLAEVEEVTAGSDHTCARSAGAIRCWGYNMSGQLGLGVSYDSNGDEASEMGDNLPAVEVGWSSSLEALASGSFHNCIKNLSAQLKCWGMNDWGQLGYGDYDTRSGPEQMGEALSELNLGESFVVGVTAGSYHTCASFTDNGVKCWGENEMGQLGLGNIDSRGGDYDHMGSTLPFVDLGEGHSVVGVQAGGRTTCVILDLGRVKCWGDNQEGQLGIGSRDVMRGHLPEQMGDNLPWVDL